MRVAAEHAAQPEQQRALTAATLAAQQQRFDADAEEKLRRYEQLLADVRERYEQLLADAHAAHRDPHAEIDAKVARLSPLQEANEKVVPCADELSSDQLPIIRRVGSTAASRGWRFRRSSG